MGVKKTMQTFFEGMQGGSAKYGGRIVNTAMGPFKWDQLNESWVNINNGFRLSNISMQDLMLIGYDSLGGDNGSAVVFNYSTENLGELFDLELSYTETYPSPIFLPLAATSFTTQPTAGITLQVSLNYLSSGNSFSFAGLTGLALSYTLNDGTSFTTLSDANNNIYIEPPLPSFGNGGDGFYLSLLAGATFNSAGLTSGFTITLTNISTPSPEQVATLTITAYNNDE